MLGMLCRPGGTQSYKIGFLLQGLQFNPKTEIHVSVFNKTPSA